MTLAKLVTVDFLVNMSKKFTALNRQTLKFMKKTYISILLVKKAVIKIKL